MDRHTCFLLLGRTLWITTRQNRLAVTCRELLLCSKETRHQEVKQWPQLQHIVLYRSSWQNEPVVGNQQLDCFWGLPKKWEKPSWDLISSYYTVCFITEEQQLNSTEHDKGNWKCSPLCSSACHCCVQLQCCISLMPSILLHIRLHKIASILHMTWPLFIITPHHL